MSVLEKINLTFRILKSINLRFFYLSNMCTSEYYDPCETMILDSTVVNYGIVILNSPINFSSQPNILLNLWSKAKVRLTVDGGTDRWLNWLESNKFDSNDIPCPDLITGDFDSVSKESLKFFDNKNVAIVKTPDQNRTDFTKALFELEHYCRDKEIKLDCLYILADTCGRLDQIIGNIHTLCLAPDILSPCKLFQLASNSVSWILNPGKHSINIPATLRNSKEWCALIPISNDCQVSTTGLKWNLSNSILKFGKFISTSNTYDGSSLVTVENNQPLLWSMGISSIL